MMHARRIGILGGTFDPIHSGHIDIGLSAQAAIGLDRLLVLTAGAPAHRPPPIASSCHRFAMAALAVAGREGWRASDLELRSGGQSFTSETLRRFHQRGHLPGELFFVVGADAFAEIAAWKDYPLLLASAHFVVVSRPGFSVRDLPRRLPALAPLMALSPADSGAEVNPMIILIDAPTTDVSSTAIRQRLAQGQSIAGLVPAGVQQHIEQHGLYSAVPPDRRASDHQADFVAGGLHGEE
jgi:nicotinate-nucleotide adenylyltransferase